MDSTAYTVEMQGLGGGSTQYLCLTFGFATSTVEPGGSGGVRLLLMSS